MVEKKTIVKFVPWPHKGRRRDVTHMLLEMSMRFALWAEQQAELPPASDIATKFNLSRATAYRWRTAYLEAKEPKG